MASTVSEFQPTVTSRELPIEEWPKILKLGLPGFDLQLPDPRWTRIAVVEVGGEIVAISPVWLALHTEPIWISPEYQKRVGIVRRLWNGVRSILDDMARLTQGGLGTIAYATIYEDNAKNVVPQAARLGFLRVPGSLYMLEVSKQKSLGESR